MAKLKFGSPAWRKKYMKAKRNPRAGTKYMVRASDGREWGTYDTKREAAAKARDLRSDRGGFRGGFRVVKVRANAPNTYTRKGAAAKKKRMREMIGNPPGSWTKVKAFRVVKKNGRAVLEVRK